MAKKKWWEQEESLVEISNDKGDHVVVHCDNLDQAHEVEGMVRRAGGTSDRDAQGVNERDAGRKWWQRDHDQVRVRSAPVVDPNEDLEPETDDDSITERNEQSANGGWWPF